MSAPRIEPLAEGVTLYLGDMLEVLPGLGEFDACVTDPPYGINAHKGIGEANRHLVASGNGGGAVGQWCASSRCF